MARDPAFTADFVKHHQDKLLFGSDCSCSDGHGSGVSQANNPAAARLAGKCVARETLGVLQRSASMEVRRKITWGNAHRMLRIPRTASLSVRPRLGPDRVEPAAVNPFRNG